VRVLTQPKHALMKQYAYLLTMEHVSFHVTPQAFRRRRKISHPSPPPSLPHSLQLHTQNLTFEQMVRVLTQAKRALMKQYAYLFTMGDVSFHVTPQALPKIGL